MDSIDDILAKKNFSEPPEIRSIKNYIRKRFDREVEISLSKDHIVVSSPSAPLIANLRANLPELKKAANTDKKIILRIG